MKLAKYLSVIAASLMTIGVAQAEDFLTVPFEAKMTPGDDILVSYDMSAQTTPVDAIECRIINGYDKGVHIGLVNGNKASFSLDALLKYVPGSEDTDNTIVSDDGFITYTMNANQGTFRIDSGDGKDINGNLFSDEDKIKYTSTVSCQYKNTLPESID